MLESGTIRGESRWVKTTLAGVFLALVVSALAVVSFRLGDDSPKPPGPPLQAEPALPAEKEYLATGVRIDSHTNGIRRSTLEVEGVRLRRKKMGVFRLGFWKEAVLEEARLVVYLDREQGNKPSSRGSVGSRMEPFDLRRVLTGEETRKALQLKGIKGLEIQGFHVDVFRAGRSVSSIRCERATLEARDAVLEMSGGVVLEAPGRGFLSAEQLDWDLKSNGIRVLGTCRGHWKGQPFHGQKVRTDLFLSTLYNERGDHVRR